jgi:hypothetical protein
VSQLEPELNNPNDPISTSRFDPPVLALRAACALLVALLFPGSVVIAQAPSQAPTQTPPPAAAQPQPPPPARASHEYDFLYQASAFVGFGAQTANQRTSTSGQLGASVGFVVPNAYLGMNVEGGYLGPWSRFGSGSGLASVNYLSQWQSGTFSKWKPFATVGYSRLFATGNAVNYGGGIDCRLSRSSALRIEVRDYYTPSGPGGHNVALRIGWLLNGND